MSPVGAIVRKELRTYFVSPIAYVVASVFLLLTGLLSFLAIATASNRSMHAARAGEPAGAEPQRTRLPPRVLQHGRDPAPSRADPDHAPARRGEKAQDD